MTSLFAAITGSRVDSENGILRGVSVITEGEAKGHRMQIDSTTLQQVKACAEAHKGGVQVKSNHGTGFESIVGVLRDFIIDGIQLRADLHLLKNHDDYSRIVEMSKTMPDAFGLSIAFSGTHDVIEGVKYARCSELYSVDLVDAPAANPSGLFSVPILRCLLPKNGKAEPDPFYKVDTNSKDNGMNKFEELAEKALAFFSRNEKATEQLSTAQAEVTTLTQKLEALSGELSTAKAKIVELETAATNTAAEHKTALEAKETDVEKRASAKALELAAQQGIPAGTVKADKAKDAPKTLTEKVLANKSKV